jgi:hypothetical protein
LVDFSNGNGNSYGYPYPSSSNNMLVMRPGNYAATGQGSDRGSAATSASNIVGAEGAAQALRRLWDYNANQVGSDCC